MAAVNALSIGKRLGDLLPRLREADARLNDTLEKIEDEFESGLPEGSYGCMLLSHERGVWTHLLYYDGVLWVETWSKKHGFHCEDAINHDIRANKIAILKRFREMWILCGGEPTRFSAQKRPYVRESHVKRQYPKRK